VALGTPVASAAVFSGVGNLLSPVYPAGITAGDAVVVFVAQKPSAANGGSVTTPAGFTLQGSKLAAGGYGTTTGDDVGNTNLWVFTKDTVNGTEGGTTLDVTTSGNSASWCVLVHIPANAGPMTYSVATAEQATAPTSPLTVLMDSDPGFTAGDMAIWAMSIPTDLDTPALYSNHGITAAGATFGAAVELREPDTTINRDQGGMLAYAPVSSGTSSGAPTITADLDGTLTNVRGPLVMIRVRELLSLGDLNGTLGDVTSTSTGTVRVTGTASNTLAGATLSAAGGVRATGTASNTLAPLTSTAAGGVRVTGTASNTLGSVTLSATGTATSGIVGSLSATLGTLTSTATGTVRVSGALSKTLDALTSAAAGAVRVAGTLASTLANATLSAAGLVRVSGTQNKTLDDATAASTGTVRIAGALTATLDSLQSQAAGQITVSAQLAVTLDNATLTATAEFARTGTANITLDSLTLTAAGVVSNENRAVLDVTLDAMVLTAIGSAYVYTPNADRTVRIRAASRTFTAKKARGQDMINVGPDGRRWVAHSPGADLDYIENWTEWLQADETIQTSQWAITTGMTLSRAGVIDGKAYVYAAGGVDGQTYVLTNTITTNQGRTDSRTITLRCRPQ
jgi:hypothetical protein